MRDIRTELEKHWEAMDAKEPFEKFEETLWWLAGDPGFTYTREEKIFDEILTNLRYEVKALIKKGNEDVRSE